MLEGLAKIGFKTSMGQSDAGFLIYVWERAGGYYLGAFTRFQINPSTMD